MQDFVARLPMLVPFMGGFVMMLVYRALRDGLR